MGDFGMEPYDSVTVETVIEVRRCFGQEWQVLKSPRSSILSVSLSIKVCCMPTLPCRLAAPSSSLGIVIRRIAAEKACEHWGAKGREDDCVFDVLTTGDLEMAVGGAY
jgi:hypothetical protein